MRYPLRWLRSFLRASAGGFRPVVEELEERDAPASFLVTTEAESGGSLRAAVNTNRCRSACSQRDRAAGNPVSSSEVHHAFPLR
jgi:hypothetical protein